MSAKITMTVLGAEAVGKTTLLATMYTKLVHSSGNLSLKASDSTGVALSKAYEKLAKRISEQGNFKSVARLLEGSQGIIEHQFQILHKSKKILDLSFYDIAGGIILEREDSKDFQEFRTILSQESSVIVNIIDGAALVEGSELYSEKVNKPTRIYELLQPALENQRPHLVLFVITKCEHWLDDEEGKRKLLEAFETRHKPVIKLVRDHQNVVGVLLPVKTLGCVTYSRVFGKGTENERINFDRKFSPPPRPVPLPFSPEQVEQPLIYGLIFVLSQHLNNLSWWDKLFRRSEYHALQNALADLSLKRHNNKVYGNFTLIEV